MAEQAPNTDGTQAAGVKSGASADDVVNALDGAAKTARAISDEAASAKPAGATADAAAASTLDLPDFGGPAARGDAQGLDLGLLDDVALRVKVELGRTQMYVEDVLRLNTASVVELDKAAGDPVDIYVNERHVARGEVLVLNENFCVRISEIIPQTASSASN